jgi:hypothetical protein
MAMKANKMKIMMYNDDFCRFMAHWVKGSHNLYIGTINFIEGTKGHGKALSSHPKTHWYGVA